MFEALYVKSPSGITNPAGLERINPRGLTDTFNRADNPTDVGPSSGEGKIPIQVGMNGGVLTTTRWGIKSQRLSLAVPTAGVANPLLLWDMGTINGKLSATFRRSSGNLANTGLVFGYVDSSNWLMWVGRYAATSNFWSLFQNLNGVGSYIYQGTQAATTGDVPFVRRTGTTIALGVGSTVLKDHTLAGVYANAGRLAGVWGSASQTTNDDGGFDDIRFEPSAS